MTTISAPVARRTTQLKTDIQRKDPTAQFKSQWTKAASSYAAGLKSALTQYGCLPMGARPIALWCSPSSPLTSSLVEDRVVQVAQAQDPDHREQAIFNLSLIDGTRSVDYLLSVLLKTYPDWTVIDALVRRHVATPDVLASLASYLRGSPCDHEQPVIAAIRALGSAAIPVLEAQLMNEHSYNAAAALTVFGKAAEPVFERALQSEDSDRHRKVLAAIMNRKYQSPRLAWLFVHHLKTGSSEMKQFAIKALALSGVKEKAVLSALIQATTHVSVLVRMAAIEALGQLGDDGLQVVECLHGLIRKGTSEWEEARAIFTALGRVAHDHPESVELVYQVAKESADERIRYEALVALGGMRPVSQKMIDLAIEGLDDGYGETALARMGKAAVPAVMTYMDSCWLDPSKRGAIRALGKMGDEAAEALPLLRQIKAESRWSDVQRDADTAISDIQYPMPHRSVASLIGSGLF